MRLTQCLAAFSLAACTPSLLAGGIIPYPNTGTIAPQVATYASASGGIDIYYFGSTASFTDFVEVYDVQTTYNSGEILDNHTTSLGTELTIGTTPGQINAGDQLIFYIESPEGQLASIASYSADSDNHAYITDYDGGLLNGVNIPAGLYVGLEDEASYNSDFNYDDDTFVFTGVSAPSINPPTTGVSPEPSSFVLLGTGLLSVAGVVRRRLTRS